METIGEYLKRVRETCGYSLDTVAGITKINLRYLEAIEKNDFSRIPGETFCHGFIRSYARCLGISEEDISRRIRETLKPEPHVIDAQLTEEQEYKTRTIKREKARIIIPAAAGVIVLAFLIILFTSGRNDKAISNSRELKAVPAETVEAEPPQAPEVKIELVVLKISANELTWINAMIDGREEKDVLLQPGEVVTWNGENKVIITVGNAGGINLNVNGVKQDPIGKRGEVVRGVVITSTGVSKS